MVLESVPSSSKGLKISWGGGGGGDGGRVLGPETLKEVCEV